MKAKYLFIVLIVALLVGAFVIADSISLNDRYKPDEGEVTEVYDVGYESTEIIPGKKVALKNVKITKTEDGSFVLEFRGGKDSSMKEFSDGGAERKYNTMLSSLKEGATNRVVIKEGKITKADVSFDERNEDFYDFDDGVYMNLIDHEVMVPFGADFKYDSNKDANFAEIKVQKDGTISPSIMGSDEKTFVLKMSAKDEKDSFNLRIDSLISEDLGSQVKVTKGDIYYRFPTIAPNEPTIEEDQNVFNGGGGGGGGFINPVPGDFILRTPVTIEGMSIDVQTDTILDFDNVLMSNYIQELSLIEEMSLRELSGEDMGEMPEPPERVESRYNPKHGPRVFFEEAVIGYSDDFGQSITERLRNREDVAIIEIGDGDADGVENNPPMNDGEYGSSNQLFGVKIGYNLKIHRDFDDPPISVILDGNNRIYPQFDKEKTIEFDTKGIDRKYASRNIEFIGNGENPPIIKLSEAANFKIGEVSGRRSFNENTGDYEFSYSDPKKLARDTKNGNNIPVVISTFREKVTAEDPSRKDIKTFDYNYNTHVIMKNGLLEGYMWYFEDNNRVITGNSRQMFVTPDKKPRVNFQSLDGKKSVFVKRS